MITVKGDIHQAVAFGKSKIGKWRYDHEAAQTTRFGQNDDEADCSGFVSKCLWEGGMPRMNGGFGESSNAMAAGSRAHPEFQLPKTAAATVFGCCIVYGGVGGSGDAGHVVFGLGDGTVLGSSSSTQGVQIKPLSYFQHSDGGVSDVLLAPVNYGASAPVTPEEETVMAGQPSKFITAGANTPWFFYDGDSFYVVDKNHAGLMLDLALVKRQPEGNQVGVVGPEMIAALGQQFGVKV